MVCVLKNVPGLQIHIQARCVVAWLAEETIEIAKSYLDDKWLPLLASVVLLGKVKTVEFCLGMPKVPNTNYKLTTLKGQFFLP